METALSGWDRAEDSSVSGPVCPSPARIGEGRKPTSSTRRVAMGKRWGAPRASAGGFSQQSNPPPPRIRWLRRFTDAASKRGGRWSVLCRGGAV